MAKLLMESKSSNVFKNKLENFLMDGKKYIELTDEEKEELNKNSKESLDEIELEIKDLNQDYKNFIYNNLNEKTLNVKDILDLLNEFDKIKQSPKLNIKNINEIKTINDLENIIKNFKESIGKYNKPTFELEYSNNTFNIYKINKEDKKLFQLIYGGKGYYYAWCVADSSKNYFEQYLNKDSLYIWTFKDDTPFALLSTASSEFKDIHNTPLKNFDNSILDGLNHFYDELSFNNDLTIYIIKLVKFHNPNLSEIQIYQELDKNKKIDWNNCEFYKNNQLSEDFIREFKNKVNWIYISAYKKLSEEFIKEFQDKVDWYFISKRQKLSESFIKEFQNKIDWKMFNENKNLSKEFKEEMFKKYGH